MECYICLSELSHDRGILSCSHAFCHPCITEWFKTNQTCPVCRHEENQIIRLGNIVPDILTCLRFLGVQYVFVENKNITSNIKCLCNQYYGTLCDCINTETNTLEEVYMCSLCSKTLIYNINTKTLTGSFDLWVSKFSYDSLPSDYVLLKHFYNKSTSQIINKIDFLLKNIKYINYKDANRLYYIIKSCLNNNDDIFEHLAHQLGPLVLQ